LLLFFFNSKVFVSTPSLELHFKSFFFSSFFQVGSGFLPGGRPWTTMFLSPSPK
jgi:hypothetical protein